ncbi:MAG TPA: anaerobic ribonucleoside-triphosphate reductase activating protein [Bacillota bacterium]|nr:anaerobic ribonucleoside-triphosphate reductase activating protein [Bacillota bacterium]
MISTKANELLERLTLRIAGVTVESLVDGPGIRSVVFFQGCPHHCPGCHNPETWAWEAGREISGLELISLLQLNPLVDGVTFSGGEPFSQTRAAVLLGRYLKSLQLNLWIYTGYTWEYLQEDPNQSGFRELLEIADVLVDGPYLAQAREMGGAFRGSANQRIINIPASLESGKVIQWQQFTNVAS